MCLSSKLSAFAAQLRPRIAALPSDPRGFPFEQLALDLFQLQYDANPAYRAFCQARKVDPSVMRRWNDIPALPAAAFKDFEVSCLPADERSRVFQSSGTTGQPRSRHFHSHDSLSVYELSAISWFKQACRRLLSAATRGGKLHFLFLTPPPALVPHSSLVHMFDTFQLQLGSRGPVFFGTVDQSGAWVVDFPALQDSMADRVATGTPVIIAGTAFNFVHLLDHLVEHDVHWFLPQGSAAFETGGYKGRSRVLERDALHRCIAGRLGLPLASIVTEYGMSELSSQAYRVTASDGSGCFHFPAWARVDLISPETGKPVRPGEVGLVRVHDLANIGSVAALQTEDLGRKHDRGFELLGRAELAEARGCSLMSL